MTLPEAIRILKEMTEVTPMDSSAKESVAAIQLGIEALERLQSMRQFPFLQNISQLPSEKEE